MKKLSSHSVIGFLAGGLVCSLTCYLFMASRDWKEVREERPTVSAMTITPEVPDSVGFCGKNIDLTRYDRREGFDRELSSFTYLHSTTLLLFKRANRYFPVIEPVLKEYGIPDDFKYLAVIESHLEPRVASHAHAVGMWQLLEGTAREFGLTITPTVDERCDVEKATVAACKYLKSAYKKYGDWTVVASSYNAGMGRISGELEKQHADHSFDLWLVEETTRYIFRIMAVKQLFENPYKYGFVFRPRDLYKPIACDEVTVSTDIQDLAAFAKQHGATYADLKRFNPWLRDRKLQTAGKSYTLKVPREKDMYYNNLNNTVHNPAWVVK